MLEHLVDVVLHFEGDKHSALRMVRGVKNRFGPADEVGCFELRDSGIVGLADPSGLFLGRFGQGADAVQPGTAVTVVMDGRRPLLAEVQALVAGANIPSPRRAVTGLDSSRVPMLLAVVERRGGLKLHDAEVYRDRRRDADHRARGRPRDRARGRLGEAGRGPARGPRRAGRARAGRRAAPGARVDRRLAEAARLGFTRAIVPTGAEVGRTGMQITEASSLREIMARIR